MRWSSARARQGAFFDTRNDEDVLSHAHAYAVHPDFELVGFVDIDSRKAEEAD